MISLNIIDNVATVKFGTSEPRTLELNQTELNCWEL